MNRLDGDKSLAVDGLSKKDFTDVTEWSVKERWEEHEGKNEYGHGGNRH